MALLRQGQLAFRSGYKVQTRWGISETAVFWLEGIGGSLVAVTLVLGGPPLALPLGVAMVAAAIGLLFYHLGNPRIAWKAIRNLRHSWISRGTVILGAFVGLGAVYAAFGAVLGQFDGVEPVARWLLIAGGVFIPLYPGLILSSSPAIPFWNSGLLPVLSLSQGLASALALLPLLSGGAQVAGGASPAIVSLWALAGHAVLLALYLATMRRRGGAAARSVDYLLRDHGVLFWGGCIALGLVVPAALGGAAAAGGGLALLVVAAVSRVTGDLALRRAVLKAGLFDPVI